MRIVGVIAEYNPFHKGHAYHLQKIRESYRADYILVVMSGDFVQRGEPALLDKYVRTQMALSGGADLVLELPVRFATGSGEYFAGGAVSLLNSLGVVDALCFGSECGEILPLMNIAGILNRAVSEEGSYTSLLKERLQQGMSYPSARMEALAAYTGDDTIEDILRLPNNILGIEYCRALLKLDSSIQPLTIPRRGSGYHQQLLSGDFPSATAIRKRILEGDMASCTPHLPEGCAHILKEALLDGGCSEVDDYSLLLKYRLMNETPESLQKYLDMSPELAGRVISRMDELGTFGGFIRCLKTKELTYTRISRALLHVLLNIRAFSMEWSAEQLPAYGRILGFRRESGALLSMIKKQSGIPLIAKVADCDKILTGKALDMIREDIWCANLYETVQAHRKNRPFRHECRRRVVKSGTP